MPKKVIWHIPVYVCMHAYMCHKCCEKFGSPADTAFQKECKVDYSTSCCEPGATEQCCEDIRIPCSAHDCGVGRQCNEISKTCENILTPVPTTAPSNIYWNNAQCSTRSYYSRHVCLNVHVCRKPGGQNGDCQRKI